MWSARTKGLAVFAVVAALAALLLWLAPDGGGGSGSTGSAGPVRVLAAASLTDALTELALGFQRAHPAVPVEVVFGSSSTLARQIEEGAPADLFLSASADWMDYLDELGQVDRPSRVEPLSNSLVAIAPAGATDVPARIEDLAGPAIHRIGIGDPAGVPAGIYARQALERLGLWEAIQPRLVPGDDVRVVVAHVERREVDVAIVYRTDAHVTPRVRELFAIPEAAQPDIRYSFARLRGADDPDAAAVFLDYITGPEGQAVFERAGFIWREDRL